MSLSGPAINEKFVVTPLCNLLRKWLWLVVCVNWTVTSGCRLLVIIAVIWTVLSIAWGPVLVDDCLSYCTPYTHDDADNNAVPSELRILYWKKVIILEMRSEGRKSLNDWWL